MSKTIYYIDLPTYQDCEGAWVNFGTFDTMEKALAWIQEHIDPNCKDGKVNLLSVGESEVDHE